MTAITLKKKIKRRYKEKGGGTVVKRRLCWRDNLFVCVDARWLSVTGRRLIGFGAEPADIVPSAPLVH